MYSGQLFAILLLITWSTMSCSCICFRFVADKMGGCIEKGQLPNFSWELPLSQVKFELKSNVVPIGKIKAGIHIHRALLFKV